MRGPRTHAFARGDARVATMFSKSSRKTHVKRQRQNTHIDTGKSGSHHGVADAPKAENVRTKLMGIKLEEVEEVYVNESKFLGTKMKDGVQYILITETDGPKGNVSAYSAEKIIGKGSFGVVYSARDTEDKSKVAIKKVMQDKRFKNRELQIMRVLRHPNIVGLKKFYYSTSSSKEIYLNMIMEFVPETLYHTAKKYLEAKKPFPTVVIKLFIFQLLRALAYMHKRNICHRDIKPQNILVDNATGECKLCDFGSAKQLVDGESNISYICSRYYRAPELVFGATLYTTAIDVWSAGCVMAELFLGYPLFAGESGVDQLVEIIKILGTPTKDEINMMNPNYTEMKFPQIKGCSLENMLKTRAPQEAIDLLQAMLRYNPQKRINAVEALTNPFFEDLKDRSIGIDLPPGMSMPSIYHWIPGELDTMPETTRKTLKRLNSQGSF